MSRVGYPLKLPRSVKAAAARLAREDGVSLNQWIAAAVAEKIGAVEATAEFLRRRAGRLTADDLLRALATAPDRPPAEADRAD
jgi:HicB family